METKDQSIENTKLTQSLESVEKKSTGFKKIITRIKWISVLAAFMAVLLFLFSTIGINKLRSARASAQAKTYVSKLFPGYIIGGSVCQGEDTDGDAYVSCDLNIGNQTDNRVINIQCPTIWKSFLGTSWKPARPNIIN